MTVLVYCLATALACWLLSKRRNVLAAFPLLAVSAARWNVGTDFWYTYLPEFRALEWVRGGGGDALRDALFEPLMGTMARCGFGETTAEALDYFLQVVDRTEIGFRSLMEVSILCGGGFRMVMAVTSLLVLSSVFAAIVRQSRWPALAAFLFVAGGSYALSLNVVRQYVAIGFCLVALDFAVRRRLVPFAVCVFVGSTFHCSALMLLPVWFLVKLDIRPRWGFAAVALGLLGGFALRPLAMRALPALGLDRYFWYFTDPRWAGEGFEFIFFAIGLCFMALGAWYWTRAADRCPHFRLWYYMTVIGTVALSFSGALPLMKRVNFYFAAPQFLMLPELILSEDNPRARRVLTVLVVVAFGLEFVVATCLLNKNEILPYGMW